MPTSKKSKSKKTGRDYSRRAVLHASRKRIEEASVLLSKKKIASKAQVLDARKSVLTTTKARSEKARGVLRRWATPDELVPEVYSTYFFCSQCGKLVNPAANYCKHCRAFIGDAHAM